MPHRSYSVETYDDGTEAPIRALAREGMEESPYSHYKLSQSTLEELQRLCTVFVLSCDGDPVGFLAAFINDKGPILKGTRVATEVFWYVSPAHRGTNNSLRLVEIYEQWARDNNCALISMCNMRNKYMERLGELYIKRS